FSREKARVLLRLDVSKMPPNAEYHGANGDLPLVWAKTYGKGRVFYASFAHDASTWENRDVRQMYFEALKWALGLTDGDTTPKPLRATAGWSKRCAGRGSDDHDTQTNRCGRSDVGGDHDDRVRAAAGRPGPGRRPRGGGLPLRARQPRRAPVPRRLG